ncbi:transposon Ty3-I Gag-Pol polyprotein [Trichonephila clavipes]|nr:transposon Ty3-I Gag-Pol polyprotein [Trichonephila clavipes]
MKLKSPTDRLARWAPQLQSFNLNMEYIPGKSNVIADMLSRHACNEENELCEVFLVAIDVPSRYAPDSESEEAQLVVPSHERTSILKNHHDAAMAGHYGADGTYTRIAKNYYWTDGKRWILIIEDRTTKWVELLALPNATAKECAITLITEVLLRDLKPRLSILVQDKHECWSEKIPFIRFALYTAKYETTGPTAAFLNFGRELRTPSEVVNDIRVVIQNDNFVPEITPYLKKFAKFSTQTREVVEEQHDSRKFYADKKRKAAPTYQPGK